MGILSSIKDVSKHAGVSVATVSRVLNNKGYVSVETRKKVEQAIKTLDYKPNEVARSLFKKQSKAIGLMVPTIMNPFFPELARAVEDVASTLGYNIILCNTDDNQVKEQHYLDVLLQKYVDGIIVSSNNLKAEQIEKLSIPVVCVDREISKEIPTVIVDNTKGAQIATQFLLDQSRKRIGHIKGPSHILNATERYKGYLNVIGAADWFESSYVVEGHYNMESAIEGTKRLLHFHPEIDGIFAANDTMAIGAIKAINQLGYHTPRDIAVIGFDGISLGKATIPELTTIAQPIYQLGERAATMLVELIEGQSAIDRVYHVLGVQLVERQST
nr:LacI family DNA-binding transcriptional regulator [Bacillus sp. SD088]